MLAVVAGGVTFESEATEIGRVVDDADAGFMERKRESRDFGGDGGAGSR